MDIEVTDYKGIKVITVKGDIDMYSSPALREELIGHINTKISVMLVDFNRVSYIDSSGIATFVEALKHMKTYNGRLQFSEIPQGIMEIFSFSKLDKVFEIYGTLDEAVNR